MAVAEAGQLWRQYLMAGFANIGITCTSYAMGWSAPTLLILGNVTTSPLEHVVTTEQSSWIGSLFSIGAIFGSLIIGFTVSTIGRKWSLISSCIPILIGWILILLTSNVAMIYAGRFFWGCSAGMLFTLTPIYCAEIATNDCRGALGSFVQLFCSVGLLLVYSIGSLTSYFVNAYVGTIFVVVYLAGLFFMPETPYYYLAKNNKKAATECLAKIRGQSHDAVQKEIDYLEEEVNISMKKTATFADLFRGTNFKAFYISCMLLFFQQFSGINTLVIYMNSIFEAAGASLDSSTSAIIIAAFLVGASCIAPLVADRLGRRTLLLISTSGTAFGLALLGIYFILAENKSPVVASLGFVPVLALVLSILSYCLGIGPLPWAIISEYLPIELKSKASPIATSCNWLLAFLTARFFAPVAEVIGMGATFLTFAVICLFNALFTLFLVPETRGKSFQEIQDILAGKSPGSLHKTKI